MAAMTAACSSAGYLYDRFVGYDKPLRGSLYGILCLLPILLFNRGYIASHLRGWIQARPWAIALILTEALYLGMIQFGIIAGLSIELLFFPSTKISCEAIVPELGGTIYALLITSCLTTFMRMRDLIGPDVFHSILLGRYHRPVHEEKIFVFLDLAGSTDYASRFGDKRTQSYLSAIFDELASPVRVHKGSIDDYVGDMALITWPMASGIEDCRCVSCVLSFISSIESNSSYWRENFGSVPRFRAAFHGGSIVTAEIGADRRKITYFGDVVNTTARIEALCKVLDKDILISSDLLRKFPSLPSHIFTRSLGHHEMRGRGMPLELFAIEVPAPLPSLEPA